MWQAIAVIASKNPLLTSWILDFRKIGRKCENRQFLHYDQDLNTRRPDGSLDRYADWLVAQLMQWSRLTNYKEFGKLQPTISRKRTISKILLKVEYY